MSTSFMTANGPTPVNSHKENKLKKKKINDKVADFVLSVIQNTYLLEMTRFDSYNFRLFIL